MITPSRNKLALRTAILAALAAGGLPTQAALAADGFAIEDNELTITGGGTSAAFSQTANLSANGVVDHIANVPSTDGVGVPSFAFDLITSGLSAGDYDFRVAVIFDKQGSSQSRIEAKIESLILTVSAGGAVTGRIPGTPNALRLLGRDGSGALEVQMNVTNVASNGPVSISGNRVTFDGARLIQRIRASNPQFDTIILEEFDELAAYDYRIIVQQKSPVPGAGGPEAVTFSTELNDVLSALPKVQTSTCAAPCAAATDVLILNSNELAAGFTNAYSVTGSFNVVPYVAPSPTPGDGGGDPGPLPSPPIGGPGDDFDLDDLLGDLEDLLEDLEFDPTTGPSQEQLAQLDQAFGNLENQLANAQEQLASGQLTVDAGFNLLNSGGQTFIKGGEAAGLGGPIDVGAAAGTLGGFADVIAGMVTQASNGTGLSQQQITQIATFTEDKLESAANMISLTTSVADVEKMMDSTTDLINKTLEAGAPLSADLVTAAVQIALKAVNNIAGDVVTKLGITNVDITKPDEVKALLRTEPAALSRTIETTPAIQSRAKVDSQAATQVLSNSGIDAEVATTIIATLGNIVNPGGVVLENGQTALGRLLSALSSAFGGGVVNAVLGGGLNLQAATSFAVDVDAVTGALTVRAGTEAYAATSTAVRLVPSTIPEGVSYLADGRAVAVADGVAIELAPAAADVLGFAAAVQRAGFPATFRTDGSVALNLGNNQRFSGTFAYDNLGSRASNCGAMSFSDPQGAVNSASYAFTLHCANGATQRILPFVDNSAFYSAVSNSGLTVRTDRNTGAITIGTVGRFKPSFFVTPLTTADQTYLTQVGTNGFAFRSRDANGDGRADYEVISSTGVQILYAMP